MSNNEYEVSIVQDKTFETIKSAVNKMVDFIKPTLGPAGNKVIISKILMKGAYDDGVMIARNFELPDPAENAIVDIIKEVAIKTNDRVGDGTTGSLLILQAIINEVAKRSRINGRMIEEELKIGLENIKGILQKSAKQIKTKADLKKVVMVAFNNESISEMISDLYIKLGKDGLITIDKSPTMDTMVEMSDGINIKRGYISPYMITNPDRMETVIEKPYILITDYRITEVNDILPLMDKMAKANKRELVIICDNMEQGALATAVINKIQGKFLLIAINTPESGTDRKVLLEDISIMTGATMFTESKGNKLEQAELEDLGRAERFICKREESIIIGPKGPKSEINKAIMGLKVAIATEKKEDQKNKLMRRLGMFTKSIAVIKVGAPTENEQKSLKYKIEDAVNAVKSAYQHGVVCGAGLALSRIKTYSSIINEALQVPARQLRNNMGLDKEVKLKPNEAHNLVTGEIGNFMSVGVMDPVDVLIAGVESAVSIASILLTSSGMIVETPKKPPMAM